MPRSEFTTFSSRDLSQYENDKLAKCSEEFSHLLDEIEKLLGPGRERSIVVTKLQEASFWARRGIVLEIQKVNQ